MSSVSVAGVTRFVTRAGLPIGALVGCFYLMADRLADMSVARISTQMHNIAGGQWFAAVILTVVSLWAVGRYDDIAHRHLRTGISAAQARISGTTAIALAQTLGFGVFTGAVARWRMLPALSFPRAVALSVFVTLSFMVGLAVVGALAMLVLPAPGWTQLPALAIVAALPVVIWLLFASDLPTVFGKPVTLPSLRASGAIVLWTFVDVTAAAAALYMLMPDTIGLGFGVFFPAYLLALAAALISGTPGGVGPFELTLLNLLPQMPSDDLLCTIVMFRVICYATPAVLSMLAMTRPLPPTPVKTAEYSRPDLSTLRRAECGVIKQNGGFWQVTPGGARAIWPTRQTLTALFDPVTADPSGSVADHAGNAAADNKIALIYKCTKRTAQVARNLGWAVMHIADEAVLDPGGFDLDIPARRTLRRKLRGASKAGLTVTAPASLPWREMARIDRDWQDARGPARGGTMGRFCPNYLSDQYVVLAWREGRLQAYASFHTCPRQWCLDLMRSHPDAPDGTMHALVVQALAAARERGVAQVSLSATPACPDPQNAIYRRLARWVAARSGGPGLRQFKSCFAPAWIPLYMAAPTGIGLGIAAADIAYSVTHPGALPHGNSVAPHNQDENYEFVMGMHS